MTNFGHSNNVIVSSLARGSLPFFFFALFANGILGTVLSGSIIENCPRRKTFGVLAHLLRKLVEASMAKGSCKSTVGAPGLNSI